MPAPPPSGFMLVSGGAQLQMETDSDDDGDELRGQAQAGGGPLPSRAEDLLSASPTCPAPAPVPNSDHRIGGARLRNNQLCNTLLGACTATVRRGNV